MKSMTFGELAEKIAAMTDEQKAQHIVGERLGEWFLVMELTVVPKDRSWAWACGAAVADGQPYLVFH